MRKKGFTLAELMITLGIIGIAAAIAAPALLNLMPQKDKMQVIKYNTMINNAIDDLLTTDGIYVTTYDIDGESTCSGLSCTDQPTVNPYRDKKYKGNLKFPNLLADKLGLTVTHADDLEHWRGTLPDGSVWTLESTEFPLILNIDINGDSKGNNNHYFLNAMTAEGSSNPDQFLFEISENGDVTGGDPMTTVYLANPNNMQNKAADKKAAGQAIHHQLKNPGIPGTPGTLQKTQNAGSFQQFELSN